MGLRALLLPVLLSLAPLSGAAQEAPPPGQVQSPVLTIDVDRLLAETLFGQRMARNIGERAEALEAENERLRIELTQEEQSLTRRRPNMEVEAFRAEADAFDARVQQVRAEQDAKQQALEAAVEEGRRSFLNSVTPVLGRLMVDSGAAVILERREVFLSASVIDVTDEAIAAIDAQLGTGLDEGSAGGGSAPASEEATVPQPAPVVPEVREEESPARPDFLPEGTAPETSDGGG